MLYFKQISLSSPDNLDYNLPLKKFFCACLRSEHWSQLLGLLVQGDCDSIHKIEPKLKGHDSELLINSISQSLKEFLNSLEIEKGQIPPEIPQELPKGRKTFVVGDFKSPENFKKYKFLSLTLADFVSDINDFALYPGFPDKEKGFDPAEENTHFLGRFMQWIIEYKQAPPVPVPVAAPLSKRELQAKRGGVPPSRGGASVRGRTPGIPAGPGRVSVGAFLVRDRASSTPSSRGGKAPVVSPASRTKPPITPPKASSSTALRGARPSVPGRQGSSGPSSITSSANITPLKKAALVHLQPDDEMEGAPSSEVSVKLPLILAKPVSTTLTHFGDNYQIDVTYSNGNKLSIFPSIQELGAGSLSRAFRAPISFNERQVDPEAYAVKELNLTPVSSVLKYLILEGDAWVISDDQAKQLYLKSAEYQKHFDLECEIGARLGGCDNGVRIFAKTGTYSYPLCHSNGKPICVKKDGILIPVLGQKIAAVMSFHSGVTLSEWVKANSNSPNLIVGLTRLLETLKQVHAQGVVHGDLHAGNVLVADTPDGPRVSLVDLGSAGFIGEFPLNSRISLARESVYVSGMILPYNAAQDTFSFALLALMLLSNGPSWVNGGQSIWAP